MSLAANMEHKHEKTIETVRYSTRAIVTPIAIMAFVAVLIKLKIIAISFGEEQ